MRRIAWIAPLVALGLAACTVAVEAPPPAPAVPTLSWAACPPDSPAGAAGGFECATAEVPLDYRDPTGRTITLALVRRPATGPGARIGTLFLNPGGPGGTGTVEIPSWVGLLPDGLQQRFDVVSWDPRGVGESTPVQCFDSADAEAAFLGDAANFPADAASTPAHLDTWARFGQACAQRAGDLLPHVHTANTARDLDLLRQAVGDDGLTYIGLSYGTFLGATYANLFPDTVRAVVLDGNVAPGHWTADGAAIPDRSIGGRIGSDVGAATTMAELLRRCGEVDTARCAFSAGSPEATTQRYEQLLDRLRRGPITLGTRTLDHPTLVTDLGNGLFIVNAFTSPVQGGSSTGWPGVATALQRLWEARDTPVPAPQDPPTADAPAAGYDGPEQGLAVTCGDAPSPTRERFVELDAAQRTTDGPLGLAVLWNDAPCVAWPTTAENAYAGPWDTPTSAPVLVIGNTGDPSTPLANAERTARELADARLLTVDGFGHTVFLNPSGCAARAQVAYLLDGTLPAPGTVCPQDTPPFPPTG